jgi:hypothetical protein
LNRVCVPLSTIESAKDSEQYRVLTVIPGLAHRSSQQRTFAAEVITNRSASNSPLENGFKSEMRTMMKRQAYPARLFYERRSVKNKRYELHCTSELSRYLQRPNQPEQAGADS